MDAFFRTHTYLVEHTNAPVRRSLMDEIDWSHRLIGIKGTRGVGKTTFLLQYAKENFAADDTRCLYVNMNNLYFQGRGFADFAGDLQLRGLAFDQGHAFLVEVRVLDGHLAFQGDAVCFDADRAGALFLCDDLAGG